MLWFRKWRKVIKVLKLSIFYQIIVLIEDVKLESECIVTHMIGNENSPDFGIVTLFLFSNSFQELTPSSAMVSIISNQMYWR